MGRDQDLDSESIPGREELEALLTAHWATPTALERLPGENLNVLVRFEGDDDAVLKITDDPDVPLGLEEAVIDRLASTGLPVPRIVPSVDGAHVVDLVHSGSAGRARLQRRLPGGPWRGRPVSGGLARDLGRTLARLHDGLAAFEHPDADRTHVWDVARADRHRDAVDLVEGPDRRRTIESILHEHVALVAPVLPSCPRGVIHGDPNDENLLVEEEHVAGIVDFGDVLEGAWVQDLAILLAYAMQATPGPGVETAAEIVRGYRAIRDLDFHEETVLFPLLRSRLATSALIGAVRRREALSHATWFSHEDSTWRAIEGLREIGPLEGRRILGLRTGGEPPAIRDLRVRRSRITGPNLSVSYDEPLHLVAGRGQYLHAADGRPYLDLVNNVCHVGHGHPRVVEALASQAARLNTNTRYLSELFLEYAERLAARLPDPIDTVFLVNSGSEANELALRLARAATGSGDVLVIDGAYHGNTGNCVAMSPYKFDGPGGSGRPEWVHVAPSPDRYRGPIRGDGDDVGPAYALELATVVGEACARGRSIGAFFAEPILSCGGQIPLPRDYLASAFAHVRRAGGVCVADEVQVGFGRVGDAFWGFELDGVDGGEPVVPDIVVMGKPIGNGHPMGAVATTR
ncbi:MAG: aminotransferase class III-fold pyridoxal phosphate-dependent enzyme, partial [Planctomycetota bacterium]|nr:aminotransferase class III-fold pyridoxal phosphate-dependent enzyme [Planctomycetota bacterium]